MRALQIFPPPLGPPFYHLLVSFEVLMFSSWNPICPWLSLRIIHLASYLILDEGTIVKNFSEECWSNLYFSGRHNDYLHWPMRLADVIWQPQITQAVTEGARVWTWPAGRSPYTETPCNPALFTFHMCSICTHDVTDLKMSEPMSTSRWDAHTTPHWLSINRNRTHWLFFLL